jgi:hypothetical protein
MTHYNQTKVLTTWFLNLPLDEYIDNTKAQSLNFKSKTYEALLDDQKPTKGSKRSSRRRKKIQIQQKTREAANQEKGKTELRNSKSRLNLKTLPKINSP